MLRRARELRANETEAEQILWNFLRDRKFLNLKFRRQHRSGKFILDFYCAEKKLCIEIDGLFHDQPDQKDRDNFRTGELAAMGIRVLRFGNEEIRNQIAAVLERIGEACR